MRNATVPVTGSDSSILLEKLSALTAQERYVLRWIGIGATNHQIGEQLYISETTVKTHVTHLLNRLNLKNRSSVAIYANSISHRFI
ncbi:MAG: helix-turn-helix transcriptional regulator [Rhizonema sp. PD38]|nr:helix-turn-helix transcriptional regulator [Rhizonema sp. PD38]